MKHKGFIYILLASSLVLSACSTKEQAGKTEVKEEIKNQNNYSSKLDDLRLYSMFMLKSNNISLCSYELINEEKNTNQDEADKFVKLVKSNSADDAKLMKVKKNFDCDDDIYTLVYSDESTYEVVLKNDNNSSTFNVIEKIEHVEYEVYRVHFFSGDTYNVLIDDIDNVKITISDNDTWIINNKDTSVKIKYNKNFVTIKFNSGRDNVSIPDQYINRHNKIKSPKLPELPGYIFSCWVDENGKSWNFDNEAETNMVLSARWKLDPNYKVEATSDLVFIYDEVTDSYICDGLTDKTLLSDGITVDRPKNIVIPSEYEGKPVTKINDGAFDTYLKKYLETIVIPDTIVEIGSKAFNNCSSLKTITIPSSVRKIELDSFANCLELVEVINKSSVNLTKDYFSEGRDFNENQIEEFIDIKKEGESQIVIVDGVYQFYTYDNRDYLLGYIGDELDIELPSMGPTKNTYIMYRRAFYDDGLNSIIIPDAVTSIGKSAFVQNNFTSITIPDSVIRIRHKAFYSCKLLNEVNLSNNVIAIEDLAFGNCKSLYSFTFTESITELGNESFYNVRLKYIYNYSSLKIETGSKDYGNLALYAEVINEKNQ